MEKDFKIPGYIIQNEIGAGGTSNVYMGIQEKLNRKVAIKILNSGVLKNREESKRFFREPEIASKLTHPNIVTIFDVGHISTYHYIIMEYLGESLKDRIHHAGILPVEETLNIVKQIAGALDYAHAKGVVHRDIKPANILFRENVTPVVVDFGLALSADTTLMLTVQGMIMGTLCYMSPEQCRGERGEQASDIYSLGVVLFEMLTGKVPYLSENPFGILHKHQNDPIPTLPAKLNRFQPLINRMMAKDKTGRIQDGKQVIEMIDALNVGQIKEDNDHTIFYRPPAAETKSSVIEKKGKKEKKKWKKHKLMFLLVLSLIAFLTVIIVIITRLK